MVVRALTRALSRWSPSRPILHQRIEQAARDGDIDKVRHILREAESPKPAAPGRRRVLSALLGYGVYNLLAAVNDYRIVGQKATQAIKAHGGEVEVTLHMKSFSTRAQVSVRTPADDFADGETSQPEHIRVIPHLYVGDIFGRSHWTLHCHKHGGHTRWWTAGPADDDSNSQASSSSWSAEASRRSGSV